MRFAIKDAGNITFYNKATGVPAFYTEDANSFEFKLSSESVYAKAKGNKAIAFDGEVTCDLKMEFEVVQFAQLSVMLASDVVDASKHKSASMKKVKVNGDKKVTLAGIKAVTGSIMAFKLEDDGQEFANKLEFTAQSLGKDTELTISSNIKEGDMVAVFYQIEKAKVKTIKMTSKGQSPNFRIEAEVAAKNTNGEMMALHLSVKNAKAKRNAELTFSAENPSKFPMELDCFPDEMDEYAELTFLVDEDGASIQSLAEKLDPTIKIK